MSKKDLDGLFHEKTCTNCGKLFIISHSWLYKINSKDKLNYYCSYNCWRKGGGDNGKYRPRY